MGRCARSPRKAQHVLKLGGSLLWYNPLHEADIWSLDVEIKAWAAHAAFAVRNSLCL